MRAPLAIGLVGLGIHGERYASHLLHDLPDARLVAVSRARAADGAAWAAAHAVRFHARWEDLIADPEVEAVAVVVPTPLTAAVAGAALAAGKPVLVEKPLAATLEEGRSLARAAEGGCLMMGQTLRWNGVVRALRQRLVDLGAPLVIAINQRFEPSTRTWLDGERGGGVILNTGVHGFDLVRHLGGDEVVEVFCRARAVTTRRTPDTFVAVLTLAGGALATVDNCRATDGRSGRIEVATAAGQLTGDHVHNRLSALVGRQARELDPGPPVPTVLEALRAFVAAARGEAGIPVTAADGLAALEIAVACERSARAGRPVRLAELG